ncbi:MAG: molecular chaperone HtpG [Halobacteriovorax sp.]|nr:molecular chaperone HtpG [Halobacteriovorax sp.]|tara:strand:- start:51202 stop:53142 length:1941 start_codon:yes stop_codon:yes gene_type:complete
MSERKGTITVETGDIFPIIKKWLYSEHDIFLRELVSNATDAITKRATLARTRNTELPDGNIKVLVNKTNKTITIEDNGLGMSEAEVEKYIAQLAFSGAEEFVKKMEDAGGPEKNTDIIGKFGLGFYSAFMVADKVEVESLSMEEGATPTKWTCEGDTDYTFSNSDKKDVGTKITLHVNSDGEEFLDEFKISSTLRNFCDFMPYPIGVLDEEKEPVKPTKEDGTVDEDAPAVAPTPSIINNTEPLWKKDPKELKDEDYKNFYRSMFPMDPEPLFWIHLKVDHPFTLEGILFFPKLNKNQPFKENNIRLYSKQVFVSDNVKNVIPDFLSLLKGSIDSTDIPLNVSRSALQGDPNIRRISNYVIKKVGESLKKLYRTDREKYESIWEDIGIFIKYGCVSDTKFDETMRDMVIFKNADNNYVTLPEYKEKIPADKKEKLENKVLYFEAGKSDYSLRNTLKEEGIQSIETEDHIDPHFMQHVETKKLGENEYKFASVDSEIHNVLDVENTTEEDIKIKDLFTKILVGETKEGQEPDLSATEVEIQKIKNSTSPAYFKTDEQMKRFAKMAQSMGQNAMFPTKKTLVINPSNALIQNALKIHEKGNNTELVDKICHHVEDLATISSEGLKNEDKDLFVKRSTDLIQELTNLAL